MFKSRAFVMVAFGLVMFLACAGQVLAQGTTTGALVGTLTDSTGAVLPGSRSRSPDRTFRARGRRSPTSRRLSLPQRSSRTRLQVDGAAERLPRPAQERHPRLLGQEGTINLMISPAGVAESGKRHRRHPAARRRPDRRRRQHHRRQFETLPSARGFQQLTTMAPGVTLEMGDHDSRFEASPTVGGSSAPENNYIIDGLSVTDPRYGTSGANLTMNFVQEVQVLTGGYQAEYGRSTGGVFNVITKSGGNASMATCSTTTATRAGRRTMSCVAGTRNW